MLSVPPGPRRAGRPLCSPGLIQREADAFDKLHVARMETYIDTNVTSRLRYGTM